MRFERLFLESFFSAEISNSGSRFCPANSSAWYSFFLESILANNPIIIEIGANNIPKAIEPTWKLHSLDPRA